MLIKVCVAFVPYLATSTIFSISHSIMLNEYFPILSPVLLMEKPRIIDFSRNMLSFETLQQIFQFHLQHHTSFI